MKYFFIFIFVLFASVAKADICVLNDKIVAEKAMQMILQQTEIIEYCSLCKSPIPKIIRVKDVLLKQEIFGNQVYYFIMVDNNEIDLAYTYLKNKEQYENLAYLSGCENVELKKINRIETSFPIIQDKKPYMFNPLSKKLDKQSGVCYGIALNTNYSSYEKNIIHFSGIDAQHSPACGTKQNRTFS